MGGGERGGWGVASPNTCRTGKWLAVVTYQAFVIETATETYIVRVIGHGINNNLNYEIGPARPLQWRRFNILELRSAGYHTIHAKYVAEDSTIT